MSERPDWIDRVLTRLDVHGLPHEYGGPGVVGSVCPLCPPELGITRYWRIPMRIDFLPNGVRFICRDGCDERDISAALARAPGAEEAVV